MHSAVQTIRQAAARQRPVRALVDRGVLPRAPWLLDVDVLQRGAIADLLPSASPLLAGRDTLPSGFGAGLSERVIELPWALARLAAGSRVLDAGSSLNHEEYLDELPVLEGLHIVTLAPEPKAFPRRGVSYAYADLRDLPYRDAYFDTVVSISTLEHVGMDNSGYGAARGRSDDPDREVAVVVAELRRVLREPGTLLITVPYGAPEDHGAFRQFGRDAIDRLVEAAAATVADVDVFRSGADGWQRSDLDAAADAHYGDGVAAEAVACVQLRFGGNG